MLNLINMTISLIRCFFEGMDIYLMESLQSVITDVLPGAFSFQFTGCDQFTEGTFDGTYTERRTKFTNVLLGKSTDFIHCGTSYGFQSRQFCFYQRKAVFKILAGSKNSSKQIFDERNSVLRTFMPSVLRSARMPRVRASFVRGISVAGGITQRSMFSIER